MSEWLTFTSEVLAVGLNALALAVIAFGAVQAFIRGLQLIFSSSRTGQKFRLIYLVFARYLVFGLTFQLAADIVETAANAGWEDLARLAAIAVIRTFLSYFLERDMGEAGEMPRLDEAEGSTVHGVAGKDRPVAAGD